MKRLSESWKPHYTDEKRAQRHWEKYHEYPAPVRQYKHWEGIGQVNGGFSFLTILKTGLMVLGGLSLLQFTGKYIKKVKKYRK